MPIPITTIHTCILKNQLNAIAAGTCLEIPLLFGYVRLTDDDDAIGDDEPMKLLLL